MTSCDCVQVCNDAVKEDISLNMNNYNYAAEMRPSFRKGCDFPLVKDASYTRDWDIEEPVKRENCERKKTKIFCTIQVSLGFCGEAWTMIESAEVPLSPLITFQRGLWVVEDNGQPAAPGL